MHTVFVFSTPHHYLKALSLEEPLGAGKASRGGNEKPPSAQVQLSGQSVSHLFVDVPQQSPVRISEPLPWH